MTGRPQAAKGRAAAQQKSAGIIDFSDEGRGGVRADPWIAMQQCCKCLIAEAKFLTGRYLFSTGCHQISTGLDFRPSASLFIYLFDFIKKEREIRGGGASTGCGQISTGCGVFRTVIHGLATSKSANPWNPWTDFLR